MNTLIIWSYIVIYVYCGTLIGLCLYVYYGNVEIFYAGFDKWIGFYGDDEKNILYYIYIPCVVLRFDRGKIN